MTVITILMRHKKTRGFVSKYLLPFRIRAKLYMQTGVAHTIKYMQNNISENVRSVLINLERLCKSKLYKIEND